MKRTYLLLQVFVCVFAIEIHSAFATTIGTGQTVNDTDPSIVGQNINFDSTLTSVPPTSTTPGYDTGAGLLNLSQDFTRSLGTGSTQVQWTGSGGFTGLAGDNAVNIGGLATPATLAWGQSGFVPEGSALVLDGVTFENNIDLGIDNSVTHEIDIGTVAILAGNISGSGNLILRSYGEAPTAVNGHIGFGEVPGPVQPVISVTGELTISDINLTFCHTSANSYYLTNYTILLSAVEGSPDVTLDSQSTWIISQFQDAVPLNQSVANLISSDPGSTIALGGYVSGSPVSVSLNVQSGYFAGHVLDDFAAPVQGFGGSLIKTGTGIFSLANDNSALGSGSLQGIGYSQGTTVQQGTLLCSNTVGSATSTGPVTVMSGGSLGGQGILAPTGSNSLTVESGGAIDLTAFDPAHPPLLPAGTFQVHLNPADNATFQAGSGMAFVLAAEHASSTLAFTGLTANLKQVIFNLTKARFRAMPGAVAGKYTLMTFDQPGAYFGSLVAGPGYKFIYEPQAIVVQVTGLPSPTR